jgi:hypothetical protein
MSKVGDFYGSLPGKTLVKNYIINGNFDIWQRATSQTSNGYGSVDRWFCHSVGTTKVHSRMEFALDQTEVSGNPKYYSRTVVTSVAGANNLCQMYQNIESVRSFSGKRVTVSFWAKSDAAKPIVVRLGSGYGSGGSPTASPLSLNQVVLLSTVWQKFILTYDAHSIPNGTVLGTDNNDRRHIVFGFDAGTTYSHWGIGQQSGTFDIAQVQLEEGEIATEFERRTVGEELALCQRYYETGKVGAVALPNHINRTAVAAGGNFLVQKRVPPSTVFYSGYTPYPAGNLSGFSSGVHYPISANPAINTYGMSSFFEFTVNLAAGTDLVIGSWTADAEL